MNYTLTLNYGRPPIALSASVVAPDLAHATVAARKITDLDAKILGESGFGEVDLVRIDGTIYTLKEAVQLEKSRNTGKPVFADLNAALAKAGVR